MIYRSNGQLLCGTRSMQRKLQTRVHVLAWIQGLCLKDLLNWLKFDYCPEIARSVLEWLIFWSRIKITFHSFMKLYRKCLVSRDFVLFFGCCDCFDCKYGGWWWCWACKLFGLKKKLWIVFVCNHCTWLCLFKMQYTYVF